ncbi:E3 ubiquitin-protein ligase bre-1-like, partial [Ylistrum balloti]|uniref:E3 ubiquitin-protein ligase bre-1-like n=1 Tax=Ylistrum balloti TaxID=509963 RepID=UPI002905C926
MAEGMAQVYLRSAIDPPCPRHPDTEAMFVCCKDGCNAALVCPQCIVEEGTHAKHKLTMLQEHLKVCKEKVLEWNKNTEENILGPLKKLAKQKEAELLAYNGEPSDLLDEIEKRGDQLHSEVDKLVKELKTKCRQIKASNRQRLEQKQRDIQTKIAEVTEDLASLDACIKATCKADIVQAAKTGISKTYSSIEPMVIEDVSFQQSETPLKDMKRFLGRVCIGDERSTREESDEEKVKRLENEIQNFTQREKADQDLLQTLQTKIDELTKQTMQDQTNIQALQSKNDELMKKVQEQIKSMAELRAQSEQQEIMELKKRQQCEGCRNPVETCRC